MASRVVSSPSITLWIWRVREVMCMDAYAISDLLAKDSVFCVEVRVFRIGDEKL